MNKARIMLGLTVIMSILAITASPAAAKFVSTSGSSTGGLQLKAGSTPKFALKSGGTTQISVTCETLEKGAWTVRQLTKQEAATEGDHLSLTGQFTKCSSEVAGEKVVTSVNSTCELQVEQKGTTFTGGVTSTCVITRGKCVITIAGGSPNTGLSTVTAVNITGGTELTSNVTGFTAAPNTPCNNLGVTATSGSFESVGIAHSVKVV